MIRRKAGTPRKPRPRGGGKFGVAPAGARTYDGILYDSRLEADYARQLDLLRHTVVMDYRVVDVKRQVSVKLEVAGRLICRHIVDFVVTFGDGRIEWHEVKGFETDVWRLKHALFTALYPERTYRVIKQVR